MTKKYDMNGLPICENQWEVLGLMPPKPSTELTELGRDMEYIDKVAIAIAPAIITLIGAIPLDAELVYRIAQAMLAEKKRVESELLGGVGNDN